MGTEIERKFIVISQEWRTQASPVHYIQGYLALGPPASVRVRIAQNTAMLNIKQSTTDITRDEFEYEIPISDAQHMLDNLCDGQTIQKNRYTLDYQGHRWEIDEFLDSNQGLCIAEIELNSVDEAYAPPPWIGNEVSQDHRYFNTYLAQHPFQTWPEKQA